MNCKNARIKMEDLLDQTLNIQESAEIKNHLRGCASCFAHYRELQWIARKLASLPYFSPSANFSEKALAALGLQEMPKALPRWEKWVLGVWGTSVSCWMLGVILFISSRLSLWKMIGATELAANPARIFALCERYLAKAVLTLWNFLATLRVLARLLAPETVHWPIQLAVATAIAGIFMATVSQKASHNAAIKKWRII